MQRLLLPLLFAASFAFADDPVFKSDVALSRVDAQVVDRDGRTVSGLQARDFILRVDGKIQPVKNFDSESMPIDILLLLDVSGSMRPHVERMADAAKQALNVLTPQDRLAIMVFDVWTRERLPFTNNRNDVANQLRHLVRSEGFNNGTRITSAMISAAQYVEKHARADARRAIVILTDDETQDSENEPKVEAALSRAGAVLSFLEAPFDPQAVTQTSPIPGPPRIPMPGGGWPGGGGNGIPGGVNLPSQLGGDHTAGTETIARDSGGDTMPINDATSLESTLSRLRQRYALHFYMPEEAQAKTQHSIRVDLSTEARIRYPDADVRSRRVFMGSSKESSGPAMVTHQTAISDPIPGEGEARMHSSNQKHKSVAVNEDSGGPAGSSIGSPNEDDATTKPAPATPPPTPVAPKGGWPVAPKP